MEKSKTQQALDLLRENPGMSQYRAAKTLGLNQSVLSRAVRSLRGKLEQERILQQGGYLERV